MMKKYATIIFALAMTYTLPAGAGPLALKQIDAAATWVLHMNVREFNTTQLAQLLQGSTAPSSFTENVAMCKESLGFNPVKDVEHFTFYGTSTKDRNGVALFFGKFDSAKITALVHKRLDCRETKKGNRTVLSWTDPHSGQIIQMCFVTPTQMLVTIGDAQIQSALDVLDGRKASLSSGGGRLSFPDKAHGFLIASAVPEATEIGLLKTAKAINLTLGEATKGQVDMRMMLQSIDEQTTATTLQIVQGLLFSAMLTAKDNPELADLAKNASVSSEGTSVILQIQYPSAKAIDLATRLANSRMQAPSAAPASDTPHAKAPTP